ncbi:MAG: translation initiation factor eIF-2B [Candidatus Hodarchaeota archaeon]
MPIDEVVQKLVDKIVNDNISGANALTRQAIEALILQIKISSESFIQDVESVFKLLLKSRPSMAPLISGTSVIMNEILENYDKIPLEELKIRAINKGEKILEESDIAIKRIIELFSNIIKDNSTIMTHSMSRTVLEILEHNKDKNLRVILTESRPQLEGIKLAKLLAGRFPITLIVDSAVGYFIKNRKIDLILVGADSILTDGSVINKIGTYPLALLAHENKVPFYVVTESLKFNLKSYFGIDVKIEEKPSNEILPEKIHGIEPKNIYFDITPSYLITSIISEKGIFSPEQFIQKITKELQFDWLKEYLL